MGGSKSVEGNGNSNKVKNSLPIILVSVQQQCWPQNNKKVIEGSSQFSGCANSCNEFVSRRSLQTMIWAGFLRYFRDSIRVPRIENRVLRIRENYQGKYLNGYCKQYYEMVIMDEAQNTSNYMKFSRKFFGPLQVHTGYLAFSLKKTDMSYDTVMKRYLCPRFTP